VKDIAPLGYSHRVPLFRRKTADLVADATSSITGEVPDSAARPKNYTPSKKELGLATPKRSSNARRVTDAAPANRREAYKQMRERQRVEAAAGMKEGDERYLLPRDRGPERALVRSIVDSRRTVGTWFFGGALIVLVGSSVRIQAIQLASNVLWALLAIGVVVDSVLISRKVKKLVNERYPKSAQRIGSLQIYGVMRALTFRRMRVPKPQVELGAAV
jgi:DUF3043 family protein